MQGFEQAFVELLYGGGELRDLGKMYKSGVAPCPMPPRIDPGWTMMSDPMRGVLQHGAVGGYLCPGAWAGGSQTGS